MFRNPMVSPDILGASTGAGFGAALAILSGFSYVGITISSFCFGLAAVFLAYAISRASRLNSTLSMVLAGIMIGSLFSAGTSFIKLIADTQEQLPAITYWLMGSLTSVKGVDPLCLDTCDSEYDTLFLLRWRINLLTVSEDEARSLGINISRLRFIVIICATLMTAAAVSVSGMIGWVGLVIPHFCRLIFGYDYRRIIPASILLGGAFMMIVDDLARTVTTSEIPLGVLTAFVGAPVFVWLILRGGADHET
jgi:iron complex transport system permease protein